MSLCDANKLSFTFRNSLFPNGTLKITNVTKRDGGTYTCIAKNQFGTASTTGRLIITGKSLFFRSTFGLEHIEVRIRLSIFFQVRFLRSFSHPILYSLFLFSIIIKNSKKPDKRSIFYHPNKDKMKFLCYKKNKLIHLSRNSLGFVW